MFIKSGIIIAFFTLISRVSGLARELFIASTFGTSAVADCINVAFKLPNLFRRIFGEGALSAVFIPMFSEKLVSSKEQALIFSGKIFVILLIILTILTISLQIMMPYVMLILAPGFLSDDQKFGLAVTLCRITMPYVIFVSAISLFGGMLNSIKKFAPFAFAPIIMNICIIITISLDKNYTEHFAISYALILAGILQLIFMYFCLWKAGLRFPISFKPRDQEVHKLVKNIGPATMSAGVQQLNLFISQSIASFIPGAVSILSYADRLYQLPLSLIGITLGTILLPELSTLYKSKDYSKATSIQAQSIKIAIAFSVPAMCGLLCLSHPIIHIIYERGGFTNTDTLMTANTLFAFALGLPAFIMSKVFSQVFYANLDTNTPFKITIYVLLLNSILNILLIMPFGYVGIAVGSSITAWINLWMLYTKSAKYSNFTFTNQIKFFTLKIIFISISMTAYLLIMKFAFGYLFYDNSLFTKSIFLLFTILSSVMFLVCIAYSLKLHITVLKYE